MSKARWVPSRDLPLDEGSSPGTSRTLRGVSKRSADQRRTPHWLPSVYKGTAIHQYYESTMALALRVRKVGGKLPEDTRKASRRFRSFPIRRICNST